MRAAVVVAVGTVLALPAAWAAEAVDDSPSRMSRSAVVLALGTDAALDVTPRIAQHPPSIVVEFPDGRVTGSLPERRLVEYGAIHSIQTHYYAPRRAGSPRFIRSLQVVLSAPFSSTVRTEPGRIIIDVEHPATVQGSTTEVALRGGSVITGGARAGVSERFRAMQDALERAAPVPMTARAAREAPRPVPSAAARAPAALGAGDAAPTAPAGRTTSWPWMAGALLVAIAAGWGLGRRSPAGRRRRLREATSAAPSRLASGIALMDQLLWQAFERSGYRLERLIEVTQPRGLLRLATKEHATTAILFVWNGPFFEKRTVEQYLTLLRDLRLPQGVLVGTGEFTVPAQRFAETHQIQLVGRDQVLELLGSSAATEHFAQQLADAHARLEAAKDAIRRSSAELETLRRQRNEASWYLGEERAKTAQVDAELADAQRTMAQSQSDAKRWEQEALRLRRQWDESEWYLGEMRSRLRALEAQLAAFEAIAVRVETAERERDQAHYVAGEERTARLALEVRLQELSTSAAQAAARERALEESLAHLRQELSSLLAERERRDGPRSPAPQLFVELWNGGRAAKHPLYAGVPRDVSRGGFGLTTEEALPGSRRLRLRVSVPGVERPIESSARLVWQRKNGRPPRYRSGFAVPDMPAPLHAHVQTLLQAPGEDAT